MKSRRLFKYLQRNAAVKKQGILTKQDIQTNSDQHIDQDFPGYPHAPAEDKLIKPRTKEDKTVAAVTIKDGEKIIQPSNKKKSNETNEEESDGSASAFEGTETMIDDE